MSDDDLAYPLHWPAWRPRAKVRKSAPFRSDAGRSVVDLDTALGRLLPELRLLGARDVVISTNVRPTIAGRLERSTTDDPGVAVYFRLANGAGPGAQHCLACDTWTRMPDNIAAIAAHVEAARGQLRWGVGDVLQAFAGYRALPAMEPRKPWWEILGVLPKAPTAEIKRRRLELLTKAHPDRGGSGNEAAEVNAAYDEVMRERGATP